MGKKLVVLGLALLVLYGGWRWWSRRAVEQPPGVLAAGMPTQRGLDHPVRLHRDGYTLTARAHYTIEARLLSRESYHLDREAKLSPVDFALGWGPMSDTRVLDKLTISQGGRFYEVRWPDTPPIPRSVIISHSANTHLIPATPQVADELDTMRPGEVVTLRGYLVDVRSADGWHWNSSLTRTDTGGGACELLWVEEAVVVDP